MSQGVLYGAEQTRVLVPKGLVKVLDLDVKFDDATSEEFAAAFPLKKVPTFAGPKGYKLTESIAIIIYLLSLKENKLLGKNTKEYASVLRWLSFASSELLATATTAFAPFLGRAQYNKKLVDENLAKLDLHVSILESRLQEFTYLVGERLTVADLFVASMFYRPFTVLYGQEWRDAHPALMRWWNTVVSTDYLNWFFADVKLTEKPLEVPKGNKKEKAPKEKAAAAPKKEKAAAAPAAPADEPVEAPKPKHPLAALGKPSIDLDEWKRKYSNEETREVALPYFWNEFYNDKEWSLWKVAFKYNDELTLTFMSNNLVGGFFNRLSASTKYLFGCSVVYGENNNNGIVGAFLVRGTEALPAFDVAPDYESYEFTKLDASSAEDRAFVENMWTWDLPVEINGEKREIADGKVFK
ncbi:hypothetical protein CANARDRAFT_25849 [[Candida] arabinofermentans NRRL YB-2248]|uniref:Elongation factor 1-gamma 1 n=1 Tax=[Candida] arabinofermentans NRRL YB-2248 TaxID=983967 RepID=A0A1E4SSQ1_9ASCO|nr:hypothetical protein CANARDRAFT_25849 [[Candida] arabinofermentans NRRL YB-2248]